MLNTAGPGRIAMNYVDTAIGAFPLTLEIQPVIRPFRDRPHLQFLANLVWSAGLRALAQVQYWQSPNCTVAD
jgi:hypothetical protein